MHFENTLTYPEFIREEINEKQNLGNTIQSFISPTNAQLICFKIL